jgi:hypothetical protein
MLFPAGHLCIFQYNTQDQLCFQVPKGMKERLTSIRVVETHDSKHFRTILKIACFNTKNKLSMDEISQLNWFMT